MTDLMFIDVVSRCLPGVLLLLAGVSKLTQMRWFVASLRHYRLLPLRSVVPVAVFIALSETALGGVLIIGWLTPWAEIGASSLFVVFTAAMVINLLRQRPDLECGCMRRGQKLNWLAVFRNLAMVSLLLVPLQRATLSSALITSAVVVSLTLLVLAIVLDINRQPHVNEHSITA
jgi:uncharacterized membrane protein YphA (DoxX/SURF4 family)